MASTNDLRRVNANHPFQAQFVNVEGWTVAVHQHHRCREIKTTARKNPENKEERNKFSFLYTKQFFKNEKG